MNSWQFSYIAREIFRLLSSSSVNMMKLASKFSIVNMHTHFLTVTSGTIERTLKCIWILQFSC